MTFSHLYRRREFCNLLHDFLDTNPCRFAVDYPAMLRVVVDRDMVALLLQCPLNLVRVPAHGLKPWPRFFRFFVIFGTFFFGFCWNVVNIDDFLVCVLGNLLGHFLLGLDVGCPVEALQ